MASSYNRSRCARSVSPPKRKPRFLAWDQSPYESAKPDYSQITFEGPSEYESELSTASNKMEISPARGRTMKEYDQHLDELRKENFDLKLRLYFLEEKMDKKFDVDGRDVHRINLQLKVDLEILQKELENKNKDIQGLLNVKGEYQKKLDEVNAKNQEIDALKERIADLEGKFQFNNLEETSDIPIVSEQFSEQEIENLTGLQFEENDEKLRQNFSGGKIKVDRSRRTSLCKNAECQVNGASFNDASATIKQQEITWLNNKTLTNEETIQRLTKELEDKNSEMLHIMEEARHLKGKAAEAESRLIHLDLKFKEDQLRISSLEGNFNDVQNRLQEKCSEMEQLQQSLCETKRMFEEEKSRTKEVSQEFARVSAELKNKVDMLENIEKKTASLDAELAETKAILQSRTVSLDTVNEKLNAREQHIAELYQVIERIVRMHDVQSILHKNMENSQICSLLDDKNNPFQKLEMLSQCIELKNTLLQEMNLGLEKARQQIESFVKEHQNLQERLQFFVAENKYLKNALNREASAQFLEQNQKKEFKISSGNNSSSLYPASFMEFSRSDQNYGQKIHIDEVLRRSSFEHDNRNVPISEENVAGSSSVASEVNTPNAAASNRDSTSLQVRPQDVCETSFQHESSSQLSSSNLPCLSTHNQSPYAPLPPRWRQLMSQKLCKFGRSNDVYQLKEDICILVLRLEQIERELQDALHEKHSVHHWKSASEEIGVLQTKLAGSQKLVFMLQHRLEDLVEFLEHLLTCNDSDLLKSGFLSPAGFASFQKYLLQSRELSCSLSQSLLGESVSNLDQLDLEPSKETDACLTEKGVFELSQRIDNLVSQWEEDFQPLKEKSLRDISVSQSRKLKPEDKKLKCSLLTVEQLSQKLSTNLLQHQQLNEQVMNRLNELPSSKKNLSLHDATLIKKHIEIMKSLQSTLKEAVDSNLELQESLKVKLDKTDLLGVESRTCSTSVGATNADLNEALCKEREARIQLENELNACAKELAHFQDRSDLMQIQLDEKKNEQQGLLLVKAQLETEVTEIKSLHEQVHLRLKTLIKESESAKNALETQQHMFSKLRTSHSETEKLLEIKCKEIKGIQDWNLKLQKEIEEKEQKLNETLCYLRQKDQELVNKQAQLDEVFKQKQSLEADYNCASQLATTLKAENADLQEKLDNSLNKTVDLSQLCDNLQQSLTQVKEKLKEMEAKCLKLETELEVEKTDKAKVMQTKQEELSRKQMQLEKMEDWNMKLQQQFQSQEVMWKQVTDENASLKTGLAALQSEKEELLNRIKSVEEKENNALSAANDCSVLENSKLQELSLLQKKVKEMGQLNKSLELEMKVYHQLVKKSSKESVNQTPQDKDKVNESLLMELLGEMRHLRTELSKAIHVNKRLQHQLLHYQKTDLKASQKVPLWLDKCISGTQTGVPHASSQPSSVTSVNTKTGLLSSGDSAELEAQDVTSVGTLSPSPSQESFSYFSGKDATGDTLGTVGVSSRQAGIKSISVLDVHTRIQDSQELLLQSGAWSSASHTSKENLVAGKNDDALSLDGSLHERVKQCLGSDGNSSRVDELSEKELVLLCGKRNASERADGGSEDFYPSGSEANSVISSHHLSPDLGIESDPNRDSCASALGNQDPDSDEVMWNKLSQHRMSILSAPVGLAKKDSQFTHNEVTYLQKTIAGYPTSKELEEKFKTHLQALANLEEYELLKKEIGECIVILKGMRARIKDRLGSSVSSNNSPVKNIEYNTCKELNRSCHMLGLCLEKSWSLVKRFVVIALPKEDSNSTLLRSNSKLKKEIGVLKNQLNAKTKELQETLDKLKIAENRREGMEKAITKQLDRTRRVLQQAKGNLEDQSRHVLQTLRAHSTPSSQAK